MDRVLILQSFREPVATGWISTCLKSVRAWCELQDYGYLFCGDELFDRLPGWYREKTAGRTAIKADLARLLWIREQLAAGRADVVVWLDADTLVLQPQQLHVSVETTCVFGEEYWVQKNTGKTSYRVKKNVHNAYCAFRTGCPILPFLIEAVQRMVRRVDARFIAPQFVGPKLLTHLHNTVGFDVDARFGALSPELIDALLDGDEKPLHLLREAMPSPLMAANLCSSLHDENDPGMAAAVALIPQVIR